MVKETLKRFQQCCSQFCSDTIRPTHSNLDPGDAAIWWHKSMSCSIRHNDLSNGFVFNTLSYYQFESVLFISHKIHVLVDTYYNVSHFLNDSDVKLRFMYPNRPFKLHQLPYDQGPNNYSSKCTRTD